ncbi:MAG: hypothetical protein OXB93_05105 [Cytophagales bacterium]|nr:hypothetical protein [Cytophagales bacterium]
MKERYLSLIEKFMAMNLIKRLFSRKESVEVQIAKRKLSFGKEGIYWYAFRDNVVDKVMDIIEDHQQQQQTAKCAEISLKLADMCVRGNLSPLFVLKNIYFLPTKDKSGQPTIELNLQVRLMSALFDAYRNSKKKEGVFISYASTRHGVDDIGRYCEAKVKVTEYHRLPDGTYQKDETYVTAKAHIEVKKAGQLWEQYPGKMLSWRAISYLLDLLFSGANEGILSSAEFDENVGLYPEDNKTEGEVIEGEVIEGEVIEEEENGN